jgi:hypothetical protein
MASFITVLKNSNKPGNFVKKIFPEILKNEENGFVYKCTLLIIV